MHRAPTRRLEGALARERHLSRAEVLICWGPASEHVVVVVVVVVVAAAVAVVVVVVVGVVAVVVVV